MNKYIAAILLFLSPAFTLLGQKYCIPQRFADSSCFKAENIGVKEIVYGRANDWRQNETTMDMLILYPTPAVDTMKKRPLIMLIHGGSFINGSKGEMYNQAMMLAKRGFVTVTINYRLGWNFKSHFNNKWDSSFYSAVYRSVQDSKAALRYLVHKADEFGIDTSWIFIGGESAGSVAALYTTYYTQANWDKELPWLSKTCGGIDNSSNILTDKFSIKGVLDMWGGMSDTTDISSEWAKHIALLIFHGTADSVVPYKSSNKPGHFDVGGYYIAQRYKHLGGLYQLNTMINGRHGDDFSDFFIIEKTCAFCKSLFCGDCKSSESSTTYINPLDTGSKPIPAVKKGTIKR